MSYTGHQTTTTITGACNQGVFENKSELHKMF